MPLLEFSTTGKQRRPDCGLYYVSTCGEYAVYHSTQVYGVPVDQEIWLAVWYATRNDGTRDTVGRVIGRRRGRGTAEKVCRKHKRAQGLKAVHEVIRKSRRPRALVAVTSQPTKQGELF